MRAFINNYLEAAKKQREENGEKGFSLIELIVVIVILGVLVAIAIPVFLGLQSTAQDNALKTAAANGATVVASLYAQGKTPTDADLNSLESGEITTVAIAAGNSGIDDICVSASGFNPAKTFYGGNGANAAGTACK